MSLQKKILVIGSNGQIGTVLTNKLGEKFGFNNVIGSDLRKPEHSTKFIFEACSVLDKETLEDIINKHTITDVYLLAAYLSTKGEKSIDKAWDLNMTGLLHVFKFCEGEKNPKYFGQVQLLSLARLHQKTMLISMLLLNQLLFMALVN